MMLSSDDDILSDADSLADESTGGSGGTYADDDQQTFVTKEGLKKLKEELEHLKTIRRREVAQRFPRP